MLSVNTVLFVLGVAAAITITLYATWLLYNRLRNKRPKLKAFSEWVKSVFDGILGL